MSNANNGLLTKIWGRFYWPIIHCTTFGYPVEPQEGDAERYRKWIEGVGITLPCKYCRESFQKFITEGDTKVTDEIFKNRESFTKWGYRIHQRVNSKLGVEYGLEYEDIVPIYESFRAKCVKKDQGCTMPIDLKVESYMKAEIRHAPVVSCRFSKMFVKYAGDRGIKLYSEMVKKYDKLLKDKNRADRDKKCIKIIDYMRKNSIDCTETNGKYKGLPTKTEIMLLAMRCSNISMHEHDNIIKKLNEFYSHN
jgi:hypothetical protein